MPIKKAEFLSNSLPLVGSDTKYFVRYRIVSDDGSLTSQWSGLYEFEGNTVQDLLQSGQIQNTLSATVSPDERYILLQWETVGASILQSSLADVFVQWSTASSPTWSVDNYEHVAVVAANNFSLLIPSGAAYGKFLVQIATHDKLVSSSTISSLGFGEVVSDTIYDAPDFDGGEI
jgi:hypothetical protein